MHSLDTRARVYTHTHTRANTHAHIHTHTCARVHTHIHKVYVTDLLPLSSITIILSTTLSPSYNWKINLSALVVRYWNMVASMKSKKKPVMLKG